jgi:hypothetical protein
MGWSDHDQSEAEIVYPAFYGMIRSRKTDTRESQA